MPRNNHTESKMHQVYDDYKMFNEPKFWKVFAESIGTIYMGIIITCLISMSLLGYFSTSIGIDYVVMLLLMYLYLSSIISYIYLFVCVHLSEVMTSDHKKNIKSFNKESFSLRKQPRWYISVYRDEEEMPAYLEFGYIVIGTVTLICSLFQVERSVKDKNGLFCLCNIIELMFFFVQLIFIIKNNSLIILSKISFIKMILSNIILTNICKWLSTSFTKLPTSNCNLQNNDCAPNTEHKKLPFFLLPCVSEFCILSFAILYDVHKKVGKVNCIRENKESEFNSRMIEELKPYLKGLIIIICLILYTMESLVTFFVYCSRPLIISVIYQNEEIVFHIMGIALSISIFRTTKHFNFTFPMYNNYFEQHLLLISAVMAIFNCLYTLGFVVDRFTIGNDSMLQNTILGYQTISLFIEIANISIQTIVINDAFYRCIETDSMYSLSDISLPNTQIVRDNTLPNSSDRDQFSASLDHFKPAANRILTLIGINIVQWMNKSFKSPYGNVFTNKYVGISTIKTPNMDSSVGIVFYYMSLPLLLLYRFHITTCICDLFDKLYETMPIRYERVIRNEGFLYFQSKRHRTSHHSEISVVPSNVGKVTPAVSIKENLSFFIAKENVIRTTDNVRQLLKSELPVMVHNDYSYVSSTHTL